jgi:ATP-binding cassette subfamily C (CFTR/MRP) protein 4
MPRKDERDDDKRIAINAYGNYSLKDVQITEVCPYDSASLLSRITYLWVFGLFNLGYKKSLVITDLFSHPKEDDPWKASLDLEYQWNRQLNLVKEGKQKKPSLLTAIIRAFGWKYLIACQGLFWGEILIRLTQPLMVGKVVRYLSQEAFSTNDAVSETEANLYGYGIVVTSVIFVVTRQHSFTVVQRIGNNIRSGITILVYKKLTKLKKSSFHDSSDIGKVLNVLANDLNRIDEICRWFIFIICGPLMAIYVVVVSWNTIGVASMGGLTVLLLFIPFNAMMGRLFNKYR